MLPSLGQVGALRADGGLHYWRCISLSKPSSSDGSRKFRSGSCLAVDSQRPLPQSPFGDQSDPLGACKPAEQLLFAHVGKRWMQKNPVLKPVLFRSWGHKMALATLALEYARQRLQLHKRRR